MRVFTFLSERISRLAPGWLRLNSVLQKAPHSPRPTVILYTDALLSIGFYHLVIKEGGPENAGSHSIAHEYPMLIVKEEQAFLISVCMNFFLIFKFSIIKNMVCYRSLFG